MCYLIFSRARRANSFWDNSLGNGVLRARFSSWSLVFLSSLGLSTIQLFFVAPVEASVIPDLSPFSDAFYLPHAVRVLAIVVLGPEAFIPLWLAEIASGVLVGANAGPPDWQGLVVLAGLGAGSALVAYLMIRNLGVFVGTFQDALRFWRPVLLIGIIAAAIDSVSKFALYADQVPPKLHLALMAMTFLGDILGLVAVALVLTFVLRWRRFLKPN